MKFLSRFLVTMAVLAAAAPAAALTDCPGVYAGKYCSNTCAYDSGDDEYQCDNFGAYDDELTLISDATKVWAWGKRGTSGRAVLFCCSYTHGGTVPPADVRTGDGDDEVYLYDSGAYYHGKSEIGTGDGTDIIQGSDFNGCSYPCDRIYPGDGADIVDAGDGDDFIFAWFLDYTDGKELSGGAGNDRIIGSGGDDEIWGDEDDDWISGGNGVDLIHGGYHQDSIYGGALADTLYSDEGLTPGEDRWEMLCCGGQGPNHEPNVAECLSTDYGCRYACDCDDPTYPDTCIDRGDFVVISCGDPVGFWAP